MKRLFKILGWSITTFLILMAVAIAFVISQIDEERIKEELAAQIFDQTGRTLTFGDRLEWNVLPDISLRLGQLSLTEPNSTDAFASINNLDLALAVWPLLNKRVEVSEIRLDGVEATIIRRADGSMNIDDLRNLGQHSARGSTLPFLSRAFFFPSGHHQDDGFLFSSANAAIDEQPLIHVDGMQISDSIIHWQDEPLKINATVSDIQLKTGRLFSDTRTFELESVDFSAHGKSDLIDFVSELKTKRIHFENLADPKNITGALQQVSVTLKGGTDQQAAEAVLTLPELNIHGYELRSPGLTLDTSVNLGPDQFSGRLQSPLSVELQKPIIRLDKLVSKLTIRAPRLPHAIDMNLDGATTINVAQQSAIIHLTGRIDESNLKGNVEVQRFTPLKSAFDINIDQLNIDRYQLPQADQPTASKTPGDRDTGDSKATAPASSRAQQHTKAATDHNQETPIDLSGLLGLHLTGKIAIEHLQASNLKLNQVRINVATKRQKLHLAPHSANLYQGSTKGSLVIDPERNAIQLSEQMQGIQVGSLLKDMAEVDRVQGKGQVNLTLSMEGKTLESMLRRLDGTVSTNLNDGAYRGINLGQVRRSIEQSLKQKTVVRATDTAEKTDFTSMTATFNIQNGVARNQDLLVSSPAVSLTGAGVIDIPENRVDYTVRIKKPNGKDKRELPVQITGTFGNLSYDVKVEEWLVQLAKSRAKKQLEERQDQIVGKVKRNVEKLLQGQSSDELDQDTQEKVIDKLGTSLKDNLQELLN